MGVAKNWIGRDTSPTEGQKTIHSTGWQNVTIQRNQDGNRDVGVSSELEVEELKFIIQARIDPLESSLDGSKWIGLVETHIQPMMRKGDLWSVQNPNETVTEYKVLSVDADEIKLERL